MSLSILHIIADLKMGGTEHLFCRHLRALTEEYQEFDNQVIVLGRLQDACAEYRARLPVTPTFLEFDGRYRDLWKSLSCIRRLRAEIRERSPVLVHSYLWLADLFTVLARSGLRVPHLAHVVDRRLDRDDARWRGRAKTRLSAWLHRRGQTQFVAVSEACKEHARHHLALRADRLLVAHNGICIEEFTTADRPQPQRDALTVGMISNFTEEKGHAFLIQAVARMLASGTPVRLRLAGYGPGEEALKALCERLAIGRAVDFLGAVDSAAEFYASLDVFAVPSVDAEGLPTTILEAMATGLPVVATDVGGATEVIRDGIDGKIVPPRNVEALIQAISDLVCDRELREKLGQSATERVRSSFTTRHMTRRIADEAYRPMLGQADAA